MMHSYGAATRLAGSWPVLRLQSPGWRYILLLLALAIPDARAGNWRTALPSCDPDAVAARPAPGNPAQVEVGRQLFYDPILSGGRSVACATCHHPQFATSDGVSLSLGDGGTGLGPERRGDPENPPEQRIARNATALFNLGHVEFAVMFHDGRVERLSSGRIRTPVGNLAPGPDTSLLAVQAMFPVLSPDEMAGHYTENEIASAVRRGLFDGDQGAWSIITDRVIAVPEYQAAFQVLLGQQRELQMGDIARALAAFMAFEWRADDSPFDRFICSQEELAPRAAAGMRLFYGKAGCARCHAGRFQTDHGFHAIAMPQFGPGKAERFETHARDTGRMRVTGRAEDAYRFRTPSLRNVAATAPYGHSGAYRTLEAVVRHHLQPVAALRAYDRRQALLPPLAGVHDFEILASPAELDAIAAANELVPVPLADEEVAALVGFLHALTDPAALAGRLGIPERVPSGLPVPGR